MKSPLALLALLAALLAAGCGDAATEPRHGQPAPDFAVTSLDGKPVRLTSLRGKVVFVNLWATWCPPCREEMPSMVRLYEQFKGQGLEIVAISEDADPDAVRRFVQKHGLSFPVALDAGKQVYRLYRATGVPETHLIDKAGVLRASQLGPFDWTSADVVQKVRELLAAPAR